ncbi:MAG: PhoH family protein [Clostridia bacterium]|nr:PhoH family protein [Clostridia bacterium]
MTTGKTVTIETGSLDRLQKLLGVFDENLDTVARELTLIYRIAGTQIVLEGEESALAVGEQVLLSLLAIIDAGEHIDKSSLLYCIALAREGRADEIGGIMKDVIAVTSRGKPVKCKTAGQKDYVKAIRKNTVTFGVGPAGTGKTYLAVCLAAAAYKGKQAEKIILTRPAVEAGEKLGFLPGDLQTKVDPYLRPLYDALQEMFGLETYAKLMEKGVIEVAPLAYMRGRTLSGAFVILDEAQNATCEQMKMFLTRLGEGSKMVITGDLTQTDLPDGKTSGLKQAVHLLRDVEDIAVCTLTEKDGVRHPLVMKIVRAYESAQKKEKKK